MGRLSDVKPIAGLPSASDSKRGEIFPVTKLDASKNEVTPEVIQGFISRSEPVVIRNLPKETFAVLASGGLYAPPLTDEMNKRKTAYVNLFFPRAEDMGKIGQWIEKHVEKPVRQIVRFTGGYTSSAAHLDGFTTNIYYLAKGRKRIWVCPRQYHHLMQTQFKSGMGSTFIPGSAGISPEHSQWIQSVPGVWQLDLEAGEVLIFNNAACVHKFSNVSESNPEAFSLRLLTDDISPMLARHHCFNWGQARFFAKMQIPSLLGLKNTLERPDGAAALDKNCETKRGGDCKADIHECSSIRSDSIMFKKSINERK